MRQKIRLDHLLTQLGLAESREKARAFIMAGITEVEGRIIDKPGHLVSPHAAVSLKEKLHPYVSRGGLKLEAALREFGVEVKGLTLLDVGASTGGFTDCLLQNGAKRVIAVDVGYGQLHWKLRKDPRVVVVEKTNIRKISPGHFKEAIHGAVIAVSFISLRLVIPPVSAILEEHSFIISLVKPQFEVGKGQVGKGGVVRDPAKHAQVIENLSYFFSEKGWLVKGQISSPILGPKGNKEFLVYLVR